MQNFKQSDIEHIIQFGKPMIENNNIIKKLWFSVDAHLCLSVMQVKYHEVMVGIRDWKA